jgi:nucleotide-binding universal stress UspA family protein
MQHLAPGTEIDGFVLKEKLPSGGMASIWRAERPDIDFPLALKVPFLDPGEDAAVIVGYEVEEMILKRLSGPHVPRFVGSGALDRIPYLAMEFVEGERIADMLDKAPLDPQRVAEVGVEIATALAALHRQKVVHLDLKPENIMLAERGVVLLDFGLAHHAELPDLFAEEGSLPRGTSAYIAPEQVLGIRIDPASDIFACGCILYQLATGEEPFGRPLTMAGWKRRLYHEPRRPRELNDRVPRWLDAVIRRSMEVDRGRRYADADRLLFDLQNPEQVAIDRGSSGSRREGFWSRLAGLFRKVDERALVGPGPAARPGGPAVILAAVDLTHGSDALAEEVLAETARLAGSSGAARIACVTVLKVAVSDNPVDASGRSAYVSRLVALKDWARPLRLPEDSISYHVLEAASPADEILAFAARNAVGHIVMGARGSSALRRHLGSVSTQVVAEAACSVTVVRIRQIEAQLAARDVVK